MLDRLADYAVEDLPALHGVPPAGVESRISSNQESGKASVSSDVGTVSETENCSPTEILSARSAMEDDPTLQSADADEKADLSIPPEETPVDSTSRPSAMENARLQSVHREMEASLRNLARDCGTRQAELFSVIEGVSATLQTVQQRLAKELKDQVEMTVKDLLNRSTEQVREQADAVVAASAEKLRASSQGLIDESEKHFSSVAETSFEYLKTTASEQIRKQLSQMLDEFLAKGTSIAQDCERRQAELSSAIEVSSANLQGVQQSVAKELKDEAEMTLKDLVSGFTELVREQADAVVAASGEKLRASSQGLIDESKMDLFNAAKTSLEYLTTSATEQIRKQIGQILDEFLAKSTSVAQDCERRQAELSSAIERATATLQSVQQCVAKELKDEAEMTLKDLLSGFTAQVREQADVVVAASGEKLRASSQGLIDETEKLLSSLAEISLENTAKKDSDESKETVGTVGPKFTDEEQQRISDLLEEVRGILSEATKRQPNSVYVPKAYRGHA
jgi:hypothetical protein